MQTAFVQRALDTFNHTLVRAQLWLRDWKQRGTQLLVREEGQAMAEYVVMLVIIAIALAAVVALAATIRDKFQQINGQINGAY